jgi:hypothetical protein
VAEGQSATWVVESNLKTDKNGIGPPNVVGMESTGPPAPKAITSPPAW